MCRYYMYACSSENVLFPGRGLSCFDALTVDSDKSCSMIIWLMFFFHIISPDIVFKIFQTMVPVFDEYGDGST